MYYIDRNGEIIAYYHTRECAMVDFMALHQMVEPWSGRTYGLHDCHGHLLTCSEEEWEADWEAAHPEENWD